MFNSSRYSFCNNMAHMTARHLWHMIFSKHCTTVILHDQYQFFQIYQAVAVVPGIPQSLRESASTGGGKSFPWILATENPLSSVRVLESICSPFYISSDIGASFLEQFDTNLRKDLQRCTDEETMIPWWNWSVGANCIRPQGYEKTSLVHSAVSHVPFSWFRLRMVVLLQFECNISFM